MSRMKIKNFFDVKKIFTEHNTEIKTLQFEASEFNHELEGVVFNFELGKDQKTVFVEINEGSKAFMEEIGVDLEDESLEALQYFVRHNPDKIKNAEEIMVNNKKTHLAK